MAYMNPQSSQSHPVIGVRFVFHTIHRSLISTILILLLSLGAARAGDPDSDYIGIYIIMNDGDTLEASGHVSQAHAKYIEADAELTAFQQANPNWNNQLVSYRLDYLADKIAETSGAPQSGALHTVSGSNAGGLVEEPENHIPPKASRTTASASPVKLLDAGSEPRTVLRLHPAVGDKQTMTMTLKMTMGMSAGGKIMPAMDLPAILMTMTTEVKDVSANGDASYDIAFDNASVAPDTNTPPTVAAAMKASLANLNNITASGKISAQGMNLGVQMNVPSDASPQLSQTLEQMKSSLSSSSTPLPNDAVGPGAKWQYTSQIKSQGMTMRQTATFELVSVDGDKVTLQSTITQNAANQKMQNPAMPQLNAELVKLAGHGSGDSILDLNHLMPVSATLDESTGMAMDVAVGQRTQTMNMDMDMHIVIESK